MTDSYHHNPNNTQTRYSNLSQSIYIYEINFRCTKFHDWASNFVHTIFEVRTVTLGFLKETKKRGFSYGSVRLLEQTTTMNISFWSRQAKKGKYIPLCKPSMHIGLPL